MFGLRNVFGVHHFHQCRWVLYVLVILMVLNYHPVEWNNHKEGSGVAFIIFGIYDRLFRFCFSFNIVISCETAFL